MFYGFQNHIKKEEPEERMWILCFFLDGRVKIWQKLGQKISKIAREYLQMIKSVI